MAQLKNAFNAGVGLTMLDSSNLASPHCTEFEIEVLPKAGRE